MKVLWIALRKGESDAEAWEQAEPYLYGRPWTEWDTRTGFPRITEDPETGLSCFRVAWPMGDDYAEQTRDRLASGLIGARVVVEA